MALQRLNENYTYTISLIFLFFFQFVQTSTNSSFKWYEEQLHAKKKDLLAKIPDIEKALEIVEYLLEEKVQIKKIF